MAKLKSVEPLYLGFVLLKDNKRPDGVPICEDGCWNFMHYLRSASDPFIRKLLERSLSNNTTIGSEYLIKLALESTTIGQYPHEIIGDVFDAMKTSMKRNRL